MRQGGSGGLKRAAGAAGGHGSQHTLTTVPLRCSGAARAVGVPLSCLWNGSSEA